MRSRRIAAAAALVVALPVLLMSGSIAAENQDGFCASCHTEPETTYVARSLTLPVDLASAHAAPAEPVRCIDCHSGPGLAGRQVSLLQGASDLTAYILGDFEQPATTTNPVGDVGCVKCHLPASREVSGQPGKLVLSGSHYHREAYLSEWGGRSPDPRGTCSVCHLAHVVEAAETWQAAVNQACDACHAALSGWIPPRDGGSNSPRP